MRPGQNVQGSRKLQANAPCSDQPQNSGLADVDVPSEHSDASERRKDLRNNSVRHDLPAAGARRGYRLDLRAVNLLDRLVKQLGAESDGANGNGDHPCKNAGTDNGDQQQRPDE